MAGAWRRLGGEDHSSTDAELGGLVGALEVATPPVHYITDCMSIVRGVREGKCHTTNPDRIHADWWMAVWELVADWEPGDFRASHVKAHRNREDIPDEDTEGVRWWHGNRLVDLWAGHAAEVNGVGLENRKALEAARDKYRRVAGWVGSVTVRCAVEMPHEKAGKIGGWGRERGAGRWRVPRHELVKVGAKMKCKHCAQEGGTTLAIRRLRSLPCWGSVVHRVGAFGRKKGGEETQGGHLLRVSWPPLGGEAVVWCTICGLYAQKAPRGLVKLCRGAATRAGKANLGSFNRNRHPKSGQGLSDGGAYLPQGVLSDGAWEGGRRGGGVERTPLGEAGEGPGPQQQGDGAAQARNGAGAATEGGGSWTGLVGGEVVGA